MPLMGHRRNPRNLHRLFASLARNVGPPGATRTENEVAAIVSINENKWAAFEIKLNPRHVDQADASLLRFAANASSASSRQPRSASRTPRSAKRFGLPLGDLGP